jgi:DNA-binding transcriptional MerR regulator
MKRRTDPPDTLTAEEQAQVPKYSIGVVSKLLRLPPQALRRYEEAGLLEPARQGGKNRLYSDQDVTALEEIAALTDQGVNAAGILQILQMRQQIQQLEQEIKDVREEQEEARKSPLADERPL